jgi:hypothetical protein
MALVDAPLLAVLVAAFALLVTADVALVLELLGRRQPWRALAALLLPPTAPYLGWTSGLRAWPLAWIVALVVYLGALVGVHL